MVVKDCKLGENVLIRDNADLFRCEIGDGTKIGSFVVIEEGVKIGSNCKIKDHVFIPTGVTIGNGVFVGPGTVFTNDKYPRAVDKDGKLLGEKDFALLKTVVEDSAVIGARAVIGPGLTIGEGSLIGMGSVVTRDFAPRSTVAGSPARIISNEGST